MGLTLFLSALLVAPVLPVGDALAHPTAPGPVPSASVSPGLPGDTLGRSGEFLRVIGVVLSGDTGVPLPGVTVEAEGTGRRSETDRRGHFSLNAIPGGEGEVTLVFRRLGYAEGRRQVAVEDGRTARIEVQLQPSAVRLDPVAVLLERTRMVGDPARGASIPGSAYHLLPADLQSRRLAFDNIHEILRQIPGMNVQDEEGYGMRPHIGIRGVGAERSQNVTLMEDGVLAAPAPYSAPAAYYFPTTGRLEGVEVRKGASQIRYGPQTLGGAVNLLSSSIPEQRSWLVDFSGGADRRLRARGRVGDRSERFGWLVEGFQSQTDGFKELQGGGDTGFQLRDVMGKLQLNSSAEAARYQELQLKLGWQDQTADETYLGLTEGEFRTSPLLRYAGSAQDVLTTEHTQAMLRYFLQAGARTDLVVTGYRHAFARNWYKLQTVGGRSLFGVVANPESNGELLAILKGAPSADDALRVRANNREYESRGVQAVLGFRAEGGGFGHNLELGVRYHQDYEDRLQWEDGYRMTPSGMVRTTAGVPGSQDNRRGEASALALFIQNEIRAGRWYLVPGIRMESINFTRLDWERSDGERRSAPELRENAVTAVIPGMGVTWEWSPRVHLFGGVHRGFGPPGPGADEETRVEESLNYELGFRLRRASVGADVTAFVADYENILGRATLATGESGAGDLFNGGAVQAFGLEVATDLELGRILALPVRVPLRAGYGWTRATFQSSFASSYGPWGTVEEGNRLPYLPEHNWSGSLGMDDGAWKLSLEWVGASAMRTEAGSGPIAPGTGADRYNVFHLNLGRELGTPGSVYGGVQNLSDQRYVVSRRPAGARPGLPRTFFLGYRIAR